VLALFKGLLLLVVVIAGARAAHKEGSGLKDFAHRHKGTSSMDSLAALVLILYSYQGWENANYVAGEIKAPGKTLKRGAFLAVGLVSILYVLVTIAYVSTSSVHHHLGLIYGSIWHVTIIPSQVFRLM
jgi:amino acid transporter